MQAAVSSRCAAVVRHGQQRRAARSGVRIERLLLSPAERAAEMLDPWDPMNPTLAGHKDMCGGSASEQWPAGRQRRSNEVPAPGKQAPPGANVAMPSAGQAEVEEQEHPASSGQGVSRNAVGTQPGAAGAGAMDVDRRPAKGGGSKRKKARRSGGAAGGQRGGRE